MVKVRFSASGYGTKTYEYKTREEAITATQDDANCTAAEHGGTACHYGDEWVAFDSCRDEIARWELLEK